MDLPVYPKAFPCPLISNYAAEVNMGVLRYEGSNGGTRQRRRYTTMPHKLSMNFIMSIRLLNAWQEWVNAFAYDWILFPGIDFQTLDPTRPHDSPLILRFISDLNYTVISEDDVSVSVVVETAPEAATATGSEQIWIVAGTPPQPSAFVISSGTPDNPALP